MRIYIILTAVLCALSLTAPFVTGVISKDGKNNSEPQDSTVTQAQEETAAEQKISVLKASTGETVQTDITEYITGVVAGEMPASFCPEALKAQAVAAYSYVKYLKEKGSDIITDSPSLHQSYISKDEQKKKWGDNYELYRERTEAAVKSVKGEYVSYNGKPALTAFHADSDGKTASAEEIWGSPVSYLVSVDAPSQGSFSTDCSFTPDEFKALFEEKGKVSITEKDIRMWVSVTAKNERGNISAVKVGEKSFSAIEIREILSLPSAAFTGRIENDTFIFTAKGKGHGVGMSQYSAEYMARQGKSYSEILEHFYPGTALVKE